MTTGSDKKNCQYTKRLKRIFEVCIHLFRKYDEDNSGVLDHEEIKALFDDLCERQGMPKMTPKELDDHLAKWDENGDGEIDLDEFLAMCTPIVEKHMNKSENESVNVKKQKKDQV